MQRETLMLAAALLISAPVLAQTPAPQPQNELLVKIVLTNQSPDDALSIIVGYPVPAKGQKLFPNTNGGLGGGLAGGIGGNLPAPAGSRPITPLPLNITGILGYPLDNSLLVRGSEDSLKTLRDALAVVDVKVENLDKDRARARLTPKLAKPSDVRQKMLGLPGAGTVTLQYKELSVDGKPEWVRAAIREAFLAELPAKTPAQAQPPAREQAPPPALPREVIEKMVLSNQLPDDAFSIITGYPVPAKPQQLFGDGGLGGGVGGHSPAPLGFRSKTPLPLNITGVLGYPLDNSLLVRGPEDSLKAVRAALAVVDVKVEHPDKEHARTTLTPKLAKPSDVRQKMLALPDAGTVTLKDEALTLEGRPDWVRAALHEAFLAELPAK